MSQTSAMFNLQAILALIIVPTLTSSLSADTVELISPNPQTNSAFGSAVAAVPDLNGDGLDDFLVSAPGEDILGFTDVGLVRVYSGANGSLIRAHAGPLGLNFTRLGSRLAGIADINQDGRGDYLVAAPNENAPGGRVYVYSGGQGTLIRSHVSPNAEPDGYFGASVASLGDINGDGINDYIIGAVGESNGVTSDAGRVYIYSGANGALIRQHTSPSAQTSGAFGNAVSGIPDVSSDGRDDYIVGAPGESAMFSPPGSGRAHIFDGATGALRHTIGSPNPSQGGGFGFAVAGTLDVFGSGLGDVVVGAPFEPLTIGSTTLAEGGRAYVFSGSSGTVGATLTEPSAQQTAFAAFGMSVATVADMDADGYQEVLIGCPLRDRVYRFNAVDDLFSLHSTYLCPDSIGSSSFGSSIAALRDANADGRGDMLIGAPSGDNAPNDPAGSGRAYLYRPVYNDSCGTLFTPLPELFVGDNAVSTLGAASGGPLSGCFNEIGFDTWYRYTATCSGLVEFDLCGAVNWDSMMAVYGGCTYAGPSGFFNCILGEPLACADDTLGCGTATRLTVAVTAGQCLRVRLGGYGMSSGFGTLTVTCFVACPSDLDGDGSVGAPDLSLLLAGWGGAAGDVDGDGTTNAADLSLLLADWGACG